MSERDSTATISGIIDALPDLINAAILLNGLIAERMRVTPSDFHCLHALHEAPATAAALAERVGLTPGSVSRMIDRLEAAGCVTRTPDPGDRRRTLIEPTGKGIERITEYYAGLTARTREDLASFDQHQLDALLTFVRSSSKSTLAEVARLRADA